MRLIVFVEAKITGIEIFIFVAFVCWFVVLDLIISQCILIAFILEIVLQYAALSSSNTKRQFSRTSFINYQIKRIWFNSHSHILCYIVLQFFNWLEIFTIYCCLTEVSAAWIQMSFTKLDSLYCKTNFMGKNCQNHFSEEFNFTLRL